MTEKGIKHNPFKIVEMFEEEVAEYTGAPYAVAVDSCTNALFLALVYHSFLWNSTKAITIPRHTYLSVGTTVLNAGYKVQFRNQAWTGKYCLDPFPIWDCAKHLTSGMYEAGSFMCLSFHIKKQLPIGKGGMVLTDNEDFVEWAKKARYEGRSPINYRDDNIMNAGWNMYMTPEQAARGLTLMQNYPTHTKPQIEDPPYKDLLENDLFKNCKVV